MENIVLILLLLLLLFSDNQYSRNFDIGFNMLFCCYSLFYIISILYIGVFTYVSIVTLIVHIFCAIAQAMLLTINLKNKLKKI